MGRKQESAGHCPGSENKLKDSDNLSPRVKVLAFTVRPLHARLT